jgi:tRNA dimethylallyltransferase
MTAASPIICLMGPTASGKTDLAIEWVSACKDLEIVSVDSTLVYRGLDIGAAKPSREILEAIPHHLIDICDPATVYSAGNFRTDALQKIAEIQHRNKIPLLVGGAMLYFWILEQGLADLPAADAHLRAQITEQASQEGWPSIHAELEKVDPAAAGKIHPNDSRRLQRAWEIYLLTGKPISDWQKETLKTSPFQFHHFILAPTNREELIKRIQIRTESLFKRGFIEEVQALRSRSDLNRELPSMRAVGYQQIWSYLEGELSLPDLHVKVTTATCQLAKRQMTWLRRWQKARWINMNESINFDTIKQICAF